MPETIKETDTPALNAIVRKKLSEAMTEVRGRLNAILFLTGGTAVASYVQGVRPLSLDLDFFVRKKDMSNVRQAFGGDFKPNPNKPVFKSLKLMTRAANGVDLDFIVRQTIRPDEQNPDLEIHLELDDRMRAQSGQTEWLDRPVSVVPPALLVISKLFAGRGAEVGKYDLADAAALIQKGLVKEDVLIQTLEHLSRGDPELRRRIFERLAVSAKKLMDPAPEDSESAERLNRFSRWMTCAGQRDKIGQELSRQR